MPLKYLGNEFVFLGVSPIRVRTMQHYGERIELKAGDHVLAEVQPFNGWIEWNDLCRTPVWARNLRSGVCQCEYECFYTEASLERDERERQQEKQREQAEAFDRRRNVPRDHEQQALLDYANKFGAGR
jgi:hypothetical protein